MKKYLFLTSVLALTACGGGSGGSSVPAKLSLNPNLYVPLNDIQFHTNTEDYTNRQSYLKFNMDENGNVSSITTTAYDGEVLNYAHTDGNKFQTSNLFVYKSGINYNDVTTYLQAHGINYHDRITTDITSATELTDTEKRQILIERNIALIKNNPYGIPANITDSALREMVTQIIGTPTWNETTVNLATKTLDSMGKNVQLKYSDFGTITTNYDYVENGIPKNTIEHGFYFGGHEDKELAKPNTEMTFVGSAVALIGTYGQGNNESMLSKTNDANLRLIGGNEILTMNFSRADNPWYDIVMNKSANQATITVTDDVTEHINGDRYKLTSNVTINDYFNTHYYGENAVKEVMATTNLSIPVDSNNGVVIDAVFGGKAQ